MAAIIDKDMLLTEFERDQIATILSRRANEIAAYLGDHRESSHHPERKGMPAAVEYALELEMNRLRRLAEKVKPKHDEEQG